LAGKHERKKQVGLGVEESLILKWYEAGDWIHLLIIWVNDEPMGTG
jgi:hypothetical protein